jgi:hypothetical protein
MGKFLVGLGYFLPVFGLLSLDFDFNLASELEAGLACEANSNLN